MRVIARVNKYVTNPIQRRWAPYLPYCAVVEHTGRKSGKGYRTPVMALVDGGTLTVMLNYGAGADWVRNTVAAGSAGILHRGRRYRLIDPVVVPADSAELPAVVREGVTTGRSALYGRLVWEPDARTV
ncbi:nitroreductase family deazaflavin-dependent oxidoreductase [Nocardia sp. 2]|uniref:Nitroreductase family deazaflavin-dependent oxidoreductase n=2 Tax=Nocardia acididurans TaxID=2802282 RepID=A0ABS1MD21_9NOCA|nr:nitroreductase family deazaflavin-dependent oxidoreductase [Nocardia acididurans]